MLVFSLPAYFVEPPRALLGRTLAMNEAMVYGRTSRAKVFALDPSSKAFSDYLERVHSITRDTPPSDQGDLVRKFRILNVVDGELTERAEPPPDSPKAAADESTDSAPAEESEQSTDDETNDLLIVAVHVPDRESSNRGKNTRWRRLVQAWRNTPDGGWKFDAKETMERWPLPRPVSR